MDGWRAKGSISFAFSDLGQHGMGLQLNLRSDRKGFSNHEDREAEGQSTLIDTEDSTVEIMLYSFIRCMHPLEYIGRLVNNRNTEL